MKNPYKFELKNLRMDKVSEGEQHTLVRRKKRESENRREKETLSNVTRTTYAILHTYIRNGYFIYPGGIFIWSFCSFVLLVFFFFLLSRSFWWKFIFSLLFSTLFHRRSSKRAPNKRAQLKHSFIHFYFTLCRFILVATLKRFFLLIFFIKPA